MNEPPQYTTVDLTAALGWHTPLITYTNPYDVSGVRSYKQTACMHNESHTCYILDKSQPRTRRFPFKRRALCRFAAQKTCVHSSLFTLLSDHHDK